MKNSPPDTDCKDNGFDGRTLYPCGGKQPPLPISTPPHPAGTSLRLDVTDWPGRHAARDGICRNILRHDRTGGDNGVVTDSHALQDGGVGTYPHPFSHYDGSRKHRSTGFGNNTVVERGEYYVVPHQAIVAQRDAAVVLEMAASIDKDILSDGDILSEIGIKRREDTKGTIYFLTEKPGEQSPYFIRSMVGGIQLKSDFPRFIAHTVHKLINFGRVKRTARTDMF